MRMPLTWEILTTTDLVKGQSFIKEQDVIIITIILEQDFCGRQKCFTSSQGKGTSIQYRPYRTTFWHLESACTLSRPIIT